MDWFKFWEGEVFFAKKVVHNLFGLFIVFFLPEKIQTSQEN